MSAPPILLLVFFSHDKCCVRCRRSGRLVRKEFFLWIPFSPGCSPGPLSPPLYWHMRDHMARTIEGCLHFFSSYRNAVAFVVGVGGGCAVLKESSLWIPFSPGCCCSPGPRNSSWFLFGACWQRLVVVRGNYIITEWRISVKNVSCTISLPFPIFIKEGVKKQQFLLRKSVL